MLMLMKERERCPKDKKQKKLSLRIKILRLESCNEIYYSSSNSKTQKFIQIEE